MRSSPVLLSRRALIVILNVLGSPSACKVRVISERTFIYLIFVFAKNKTYDFSQDETISSSTFVVEHGTSLRWEILPLGIVVEPPRQLLITRTCVSSNSPCKT